MIAEKSLVTPDPTAPRNLEQLVAWEASDEGVEQVQLLEQRLPFYQMAEYRVSTEKRTPEEVVTQILRLDIF